MWTFSEPRETGTVGDTLDAVDQGTIDSRWAQKWFIS